MRNLFSAARKFFASIGVIFVFTTPAFAQTVVTPISATPLALLRFEPSNPNIGQLVTPIIEGTWHNGCVPRNGQMSGDSFRRVVTLSLALATTFCGQAFQPYKIELPPVKFEAVGQYEFQVVDDSGGGYAPAFLTVHLGYIGAQADVSGLWFEPATSGSGLFMTQSLTRSFDPIFGAWFYYTPVGAPAWLSFQEGKWQSAGVLVGNVYQTSAEAKVCAPFDPICNANWSPTAASSIRKVGSYVFTSKDANSADLVITSSISVSRKIQLVKQLP
jgi:hypothetical protein